MVNIYTPVGRLLLVAGVAGVRRVEWQALLDGHAVEEEPYQADGFDILIDARQQLRQYFAGARKSFELELEPAGSEFQNLVWEALREIPYGETRTYGAIARQIHRPAAARAVGMACGQNPWPVIIPCHRVVAADGSLGGYTGGLAIKEYLLDLERENRPQFPVVPPERG